MLRLKLNHITRPVEELMKAASADFTGEKGNPYHSCFLDAISDGKHKSFLCIKITASP